MSNFSRRQLAKYAVEQMLAKRPSANLSMRLAAALIASGRQKEADLLLSDIDQELEERGLLARAQLTSAFPLSLTLKKQLIYQLKKMTGAKEVALREQVDKNVISGIKVETAARAWDKTLKSTLSRLKENA